LSKLFFYTAFATSNHPKKGNYDRVMARGMQIASGITRHEFFIDQMTAFLDCTLFTRNMLSFLNYK